MNTAPSPLASYGSAGFLLVILQWVLYARYGVTVPDDVALAAAALLGNTFHTLRQTNFVQAWFTRAPPPVSIPPAAVQIMKRANDALAAMEVRTGLPADAWRVPAPPPGDASTHQSLPADAPAALHASPAPSVHPGPITHFPAGV